MELVATIYADPIARSTGKCDFNFLTERFYPVFKKDYSDRSICRSVNMTGEPVNTPY